MTSYTNALSGGLIQPSNMSYAAYPFAEDLILAWPSAFSNNPKVTAAIMDLTAEEEGLSVILSDARHVSVGENILLNNRGEADFAVVSRNEAGELAPVIPVLKSGQSFYIYLTDNSQPQGTWNVIPFGAGSVVVTSVGAQSNDEQALVIDGNPSNPIRGAGILTFKLSDALRALAIFTKKGFATLTSKGWEGRTLQAGQNIAVKDGDGEKGDPVIATKEDVGFKTAGIEVLEIAKLSSKEVIREFNIAKGAIHNELMAKNSTKIDKLRSSGHKCLISGNNEHYEYQEVIPTPNQSWYVAANNPGKGWVVFQSLIDVWNYTEGLFDGKKLANKSVPDGALEHGFLMPFARAGVTKELENPGVNHKVKIYTTWNVRAVSLESGVFYVHFTNYTPGNTRYLCSVTPYISNLSLYHKGILKFGIIDKRDYCAGVYCQFWDVSGKFVENCNFDVVVWT
jgi:hypothetical protein